MKLVLKKNNYHFLIIIESSENYGWYLMHDVIATLSAFSLLITLNSIRCSKLFQN